MLELLTLLANKVKDIAYKIGLIADYVTEYGTSGVWSYRKYKSGYCECWTPITQVLTSTNAVSALMGGYYGYIELRLPFTFDSSSSMAVGHGYLGTGLGFMDMPIISSSGVWVVASVFGNQNDKNVRVKFRVCGYLA